MSKKKKAANPSGKQSREQLLNQQKGDAGKKEEAKPEKTMMEIMREKREAMFGSLAKPTPQPIAPPPVANPLAASAPAPRPPVASTSTPAPANGTATRQNVTATPSRNGTSTPIPAAQVPSPSTAHPAGPSNGINTPSATGMLPSPNGSLKPPTGVNSWREVFKMTAAARQVWFNEVPGAEVTYNMILENAKRKHAQTAAEKAKTNGTTTPPTAQGSTTPPVAKGTTTPPVAQATPSNAPGPSRTALPAFTSPLAGTPVPSRPSTPVSVAAPATASASTVAVSNTTPGRQPYHNPMNPNPVSGPNPPQNTAQEIQFLRAENEDMRSIMVDLSSALHSEVARRDLHMTDATSRMGPHIARASQEQFQTAAAMIQSVELQRLQDTLSTLTVETGKVKQENQEHVKELATIRTDVDKLRKDNTRLAVETSKEKSSREALQSDKAKLEAQVEHLKRQLQQRDEKVLEAEKEARRYRNEVDLIKPSINRLRDVIQAGEKERKKIKIRLDAVKLLVLQDDLGDLSTLDLESTPAPVPVDVITRIAEQPPSLTPNSILPVPEPRVVDAASSSSPTWSKDIKERAKSIESVKLLKVAWKLAAMERIVLPSPPSSPGAFGSASAATSSPTMSVNGATSSMIGDKTVATTNGAAVSNDDKQGKKAIVTSAPGSSNGVKPQETKGKESSLGEVGTSAGAPSKPKSTELVQKQTASLSSPPKTRDLLPTTDQTKSSPFAVTKSAPAAVVFEPTASQPVVTETRFVLVSKRNDATSSDSILNGKPAASAATVDETAPAATAGPKLQITATPAPQLPAKEPKPKIAPSSAAPARAGSKSNLLNNKRPSKDPVKVPKSNSVLKTAKKVTPNPPAPISIWPEDLEIKDEDLKPDAHFEMLSDASDSDAEEPSDREGTDAGDADPHRTPSHLGSQTTVPATSIFTARSRKTRAGKTRIASRAYERLLLQRANISPAAKPSSSVSSEYQTASGSEADSMSVASEADSDSTSDAGTSDVSDLELDAKAVQTVQPQGSIMKLPDEILQRIAEYLKPEYHPKEERYRDMRVVLREQDDIFNPSWGKDLYGLATTCRRFRNLLYDCNRLQCVQVIDSEQGLESMTKNIPKKKKDFVKAVIIGNNLRVDEGVHAPNYLYYLEDFPNLKAIQHRPYYETDSCKMTAAPFGFTPLDALDIFVPDVMCTADQKPPKDWEPTEVKSLTLRENDWWMLYNDITLGPGGGRCKEYFDNLCRYFTGVKQLNLLPVLIGERYSSPDHEAVGRNTKTWINMSNLPDVEIVNIRFDAAHKFKKEGICALPRIEHILTHFSPKLRHVKVTVDLDNRFATDAFTASLGARRPELPYWDIITKHYLPTPARVQEFSRTLAKHIPALETVEFIIYDYTTKALPLFNYKCNVLRVKKSEPGRPGSFRLQESTLNRLDKHSE